jgi:hypothetical protein
MFEEEPGMTLSDITVAEKRAGPRTRGRADARGEEGSAPTVRDAGFLALLVVLSSLTYLRGLGLYSDDWSLLADLHAWPDPSLLGLYQSLLTSGISTRPLQGMLLAVLYWLFGLQPFGYHAANTLMLAAIVVLFYLGLRGLGLPRLVALTVPLIFALLPHYSTDRFWIAAFQAPLSVLLYVLSLYADVRFVRTADRRRWLWKLLGTLALVGSVLAYEITAALFLLNPFIVWHASRMLEAPTARVRAIGLPVGAPLHWPRLALLLGSNVLALALAVAYKASTTERTAAMGSLIWWIRHSAQEATTVAFGSYGIALPVKVARALQLHFDPAILAVSLLIGGLVWLYLTRAFDSGAVRSLSRAAWLRLSLMGVVAFATAYAIVLATFEIGFDTTGIHNRTAMAAALGVALTFVAVIGWVSASIPSERVGWRLFRASVAVLAASGSLLVSTIGAFWTDAARQQEVVLEVLRAEFDSLPPGSVVLLDGICRYSGPAVVFETQWDVRGMLRLEFEDRSLSGDVVRPGIEINPDGIRTVLYGDVINTYPYGDHLQVLHVGTGTAHTLESHDAALFYFGEMTDAGASCPPGVEGYGARIF